MKVVKVLGTGCAKCKTTYNNIVEAAKQLDVPVEIIKIEEIEEILKYNVMTTPVLLVNDVVIAKGRVAEIPEIKQALSNV
jgi:small redox-active disulfide protein 2